MRRHWLGGMAAAIVLLALSASAALAGGWATITPDDAAVQPQAGETTTFGFLVLQHGQTPAGWVHPTVVVEDLATGKTLSVAATPQGADGHFVASMAFPQAGYWSWRVELSDLSAETPPRMMTVLTADGAVPAFDPLTALLMIDRTKSELRAEFGTAYDQRIEELEGRIAADRGQITALQYEADTASRERDALEARIGQGGGGPVQIIGVLALGALAGALAGFGIVALGRRPAFVASPDEELAAPGLAATTC